MKLNTRFPLHLLAGLAALSSTAALHSPSAYADDFVEIATAAGLQIGREGITGYLQIRDGSRTLDLDIDSRVNFYLHGAFEFMGKAYVLVYNTASNIPSGRRLSRGAEGSDLYSVLEKDGVAEFELVGSLPVGIDVTLATAYFGDTIVICATNACAHLVAEADGKISYSDVALPPQHEVVELTFGKTLLQRVYNDQVEDLPADDTPIFAICSVDQIISQCEDVPPDVIPYNIDNIGNYKIATDFQTVIEFDYERLGIANYSQSNLEGRIAWSNVYFLSGLTSLYNMVEPSSFREEVKQRLVRELEAIAALGETAYPAFMAKRYSLDREPMPSVLHYSRISKVAERARDIVGDALVARILAMSLPPAVDFKGTLEVVVGDEMYIRKYAPFWSDGTNVPWNYKSAWIEAMSLTGYYPNFDGTIDHMIVDFLNFERVMERPVWGYAGGLFYDGWDQENSPSTNTPVWAGQKQNSPNAHISYRSMDALALLAAANAGSSAVPSGFSDHVKELMRSGSLYPFVNEGLTPPVHIPFGVARFSARSYLPWHFQNQVWALRSILPDN